MGEGTVEGLFHLGGEIGLGIVGPAMVLAVERRELGLHEQPLTRRALLRQIQQRLPDQRFLIVDQLIGRIDRREPGGHGLQYQLSRGLFFPSGSVHERGNRHLIVGSQHDVKSSTPYLTQILTTVSMFQ